MVHSGVINYVKPALTNESAISGMCCPVCVGFRGLSYDGALDEDAR
jgi:hypothetical protein